VITALTRVVSLTKATTMHNLKNDILDAVNCLKQENNSIEVRSACELFQAYATGTWADLQDFDKLKQKLLNKGEQFRANAEDSGKKIAKLASGFIRDNMVILTHGYSPVVNTLLLFAMSQGRRFKVIITESKPNTQILKTVETFLSHGIQVTVITDSSVAHIMADVDIVLVGALAVVESGGILNQIGTYQISIVASALNIPVYCAVQSFKFTRIYPLTQKDIPPGNQTSKDNTLSEMDSLKIKFPNFKIHAPSLDYTPPNFLTLLFTDLGILTPSAVSDELIKIYSSGFQ